MVLFATMLFHFSPQDKAERPSVAVALFSQVSPVYSRVPSLGFREKSGLDGNGNGGIRPHSLFFGI